MPPTVTQGRLGGGESGTQSVLELPHVPQLLCVRYPWQKGELRDGVGLVA